MSQALAYRALGGDLADVPGSAGQRPLAGVAAALEQDGAAAVNDEQVAGRMIVSAITALDSL